MTNIKKNYKSFMNSSPEQCSIGILEITHMCIIYLYDFEYGLGNA
jgi:hypothetical protein